MKNKILIIGPAQHGKSTVGEGLADALGVKRGSCSDIILEHLCTSLDHVLPRWGWRDSILEHKEEMRPLLIAMGDYLCKADPAALAGELYDRGVVFVDGVRRREEFDHIVAKYKPTILWVERSGVAPRTDNLELTADDAHHIIRNNYKPGVAIGAALSMIGEK